MKLHRRQAVVARHRRREVPEPRQAQVEREVRGGRVDERGRQRAAGGEPTKRALAAEGSEGGGDRVGRGRVGGELLGAPAVAGGARLVGRVVVEWRRSSVRETEARSSTDVDLVRDREPGALLVGAQAEREAVRQADHRRVERRPGEVVHVVGRPGVDVGVPALAVDVVRVAEAAAQPEQQRRRPPEPGSRSRSTRAARWSGGAGGADRCRPALIPKHVLVVVVLGVAQARSGAARR